jgi:hypothetical protein
MSTTARWRVVAATVFAVGCALRIGLVLASQGGPAGNYGYDQGVYYTAADALTFGRLPYRDFTLLHPPGVMLALTPFAVIGRLTTDHTGFIVANASFAVLGSLNGALVVAIARRAGLSLIAGAAGGLFYAVWYGAVSAEISARLEPLGSFAFLCGVLALTTTGRSARRTLVLAGAALGLAVSVKMWWIVPVLVVLAWQLRSADARRRVVPLVGGVLGAVLLVDGPFFLAAPHAMWRMVVSDQLGRNASNTSPLVRLEELSSLRSALAGVPTTVIAAALLAGTVVAVVLGAAAWRVTTGRLFVLVAVSQLVVLLLAPIYFSYYSGYLAAAAALVVAAATHRVKAPQGIGRFGEATAAVAVTLVAALTATAMLSRPIRIVQPFPTPAVARGVAQARCVMADSPLALIELNVLSRGLAAGCPNWVDVSGRTYDVDAPPPGRPVARAANAKWQRDLRNYLLSGDAEITIRAATGYSPQTKKRLAGLPAIARFGGYVLREVPRARTGY